MKHLAISRLARSFDIDALAWSDLALGAPTAVAVDLQLEVLRNAPIVAVRSPGLDHFLFNRVWGLDHASDRLDEQMGRFAALGVERYFLTAPADAKALRRRLEARGLVRFHRPWIELTRGRDEAVPTVSTPFEVRQIGTEHATDFGRILAQGLDMPTAAEPLLAAAIGRRHWHAFMAFDGDRPVAAGNLFVAEDRAYLAGGATLPSHRCRGAQLALLAARVQVALDLGCRTISSETGVAVPGQPNWSQRNMMKCGLRPVGQRDHYHRPSAV